MRFSLDDLTAKEIIEVERYSGLPVSGWDLGNVSMGLMVGLVYVMLRREKPRLKLEIVEGWNMAKLSDIGNELFGGADEDEDDEEPMGNAAAGAQASAETASSTDSALTSFPTSSNDSRVSPRQPTGTSRLTNVSSYEHASNS